MGCEQVDRRDAITRTFLFKVSPAMSASVCRVHAQDFNEAFSFMTRSALLAEKVLEEKREVEERRSENEMKTRRSEKKREKQEREGGLRARRRAATKRAKSG